VFNSTAEKTMAELGTARKKLPSLAIQWTSKGMLSFNLYAALRYSAFAGHLGLYLRRISAGYLFSVQ
jgi:hypothetical protein